MTRPSTANIDLDALRENYLLASSIASGKTLAVIKANAYGHGASYWRKFKGTGGPIESFANLFAIQNNPQARAWAERNIPNLWAKFVQKMEQVANG